MACRYAAYLVVGVSLIFGFVLFDGVLKCKAAEAEEREKATRRSGGYVKVEDQDDEDKGP